MASALLCCLRLLSSINPTSRSKTCPRPLHTMPCPAERWGRDWALLALAAAENTALCLEHYCDAIFGCEP